MSGPDHGINLNADPDLLAGFLDETRDQLSLVADQLVQLENQPGNKPIIEAIFRTAHSIKGNAAFFGFMVAKELAHRLENILDAMRKDKLTADRAVISCLLSGLDHLGAIFERIRNGGSESGDAKIHEQIIAAIAEQEQRAGVGTDAGPDWAIIQRDISRAEELASSLPIDQQIVVGRILDHLRSFEPGGTIRIRSLPTQGILGDLDGILAPEIDGQLDAEKSARVLILLEKLCESATDDAARLHALEMLDGYRTFIEAMGFDPLLREFLRERLVKIPAMGGFANLLPKPETTVHTPAAAGRIATALEPKVVTERQPQSDRTLKSLPGTPPEPKAGHSQTDKSMRISESRIDTFLHYVGELLVVGDMFDHLQGRALGLSAGGHPNLHLLARDLRRANETFGDLSNKLQGAIMGIRKVSIKPLLQKVPRIVRDASHAKEKEAVVVIEGDDVEIDKSLVDLMDSPLTHMSRNAADHGIERPDLREKAGKPRVGTILIKAAETSSSIVLTIEDDGGGLDLERIRAKAESLGLVKPGTVMTDQDVVNCIFASGLSTAETITDISGRGVGMDVVKRAIEDAGGTIQVSTVRGKGSKFVLSLPKRVTTQILPGYLMRLRGQLFVVPLDRVRETFRILPEEISTMANRGRCLMRHGEVLPLLALADALELPAMASVHRATAVTLESKHRLLAVEVDQVVGVQKVVVRSINGLPTTNRLLGGGALMGDGSVALILNVDALAEC